MAHAGFDHLHTPMGAVLIIASYFLLTACTIAGSFMIKAAMKREKAMREEMRRNYEAQKESKL